MLNAGELRESSKTGEFDCSPTFCGLRHGRETLATCSQSRIAATGKRSKAFDIRKAWTSHVRTVENLPAACSSAAQVQKKKNFWTCTSETF